MIKRETFSLHDYVHPKRTPTPIPPIFFNFLSNLDFCPALKSCHETLLDRGPFGYSSEISLDKS